MTKAIIVVDMVKGFVEPKTEDGKCNLYMENAKALIPHINKVLATANVNDVIIFVNDTHEKDADEFEIFPAHCLVTSEECLLVDGLTAPINAERQFLEKNTFDAFEDTELESIINIVDADEIHIVGVATEVCVLATALHAHAVRFGDVYVYENCIAGIEPKLAKAACDIMSFHGINLLVGE